MRGFDYLIVLFSVLLGLSLSRLLVGLARVVVDPERRIHWLPLLWTIQLFIFQVVLWWLVFQRAEQESWSFLHYVVLIGYPVLFFFQAVLLYPELGPDDEGTLQSFLSRRRWFFAIFILFFLLDIAEAILAAEVAWTWRGLATAILIPGAIFGTAMVTRNRAYHAVVALLALLFAVGSAIGQLPTIA
jgi:hypothetical protein